MEQTFLPKVIIPMIVAVLAIAPLFLGIYHLSLLLSIIYWSALAASWDFFSGTTKYISLGSAAFFGLGVYMVAISKNLAVGLLLAMSLGSAASFAVGLVTLRLSGMYFAIFTFGLSELIKNAILWWETTITGTVGRWVITGLSHVTIYYIVLATSLVFLLLITFIKRTRLGIALKAIGECEEAATHLGINVSLYKTLGYAISCTMMSAIGACVAARWAYIDPRIAFDPLYSFMPAIMVLFGGTGKLGGSIVGAVVISLLSEILLTGFRDYYLIILGSILLIILRFLPRGMIEAVSKARWFKS